VKLPEWIAAGKLPPWTGNDEAMRLWLEEWLCDMYEEEAVEERTPLARALWFAKHGNLGPLRELYPDHAEFINLPKRGRGQRFPNESAEYNPILRAAIDARRIRALWKKFYPGRRRGRNEKSAEAFAAELWNGYEDDDGKPIKITTNMVRNRLKKKLPPSK
jgi:hypothetical protein